MPLANLEHMGETLLDLAHILEKLQVDGLRPLPPVPLAWQHLQFAATVSDSREAGAGTLFVALPGERTNGHNFLPDVAKRGARGALVEAREVGHRTPTLDTLTRPWVVFDVSTANGHNPYASVPPAPEEQTFVLIAVENTLAALQHLAARHRASLSPGVVAITGSVGKTTTKEVVAAVLCRRYATLKSKRSFNSDVTVPTTLLHLTPKHEAAVIELGMWKAGEIEMLASIARPHIGIVTNVGPSHLERMGSIEAIAAAKAELVEALPAEGVAILNADDERVAAMAARARARVFRYSLGNPATDLWADNLVSHGLQGITFDAHYQGEVVSLTVPLPGSHQVYTALAAAAAGLCMGLSWEEIREGLQDTTSAQLRLRSFAGGTPAAPCTIIDDTYNASPASALAALDLLAACGTQRQRVAVLGTMLELGSYEEKAHRLVGQRVARVVDRLVCVGRQARWIAEEARASGMLPEQVVWVGQTPDATAAVESFLQPGDYLLVKGSRALAMEQIVAALTPAPAEEAAPAEVIR